LNNYFLLVYSLEPYTLNAKDLLADDAVRKCLAKISIVTDKQRLQNNNNGGAVQPEERNAEGIWYYQETTKNFDKLPLMYKGKSHSINSRKQYLFFLFV
jgi:hypothetical protein